MNLMVLKKLLMIGIDQQTPIQIREKVSFDKRIYEALDKIKSTNGVLEGVILSTCHRSEIYLLVEDLEVDGIRRFFNRFFSIECAVLEPYIYSLKGIQVVNHLFRVAAGLESMVVGEDQILGQVRDAWHIAREREATGKILDKLFREAVTLGKRVRAETGISDHSISISYIAVLFIQEAFEDLRDKSAYIIGAGEMGRLAIQHLLAKGIGEVFVSNRTYDRALALKQEIPDITVVPYEQKYELISQIPIVISATNAPHYTVDFTKFKDHYCGDKICMVDLALPRDIDPQVGKIDGVNLYTVDDLKKVAQENQKKRESLIIEIEGMVKKGVEDFIRWNNALCTVPVIKHLNEYAGKVCAIEYKRIINKLPDVNDSEKGKIKYALERVATKMVNHYLSGIKTLAEGGKLDESVIKIFKGGDDDEKADTSWESRKQISASTN